MNNQQAIDRQAPTPGDEPRELRVGVVGIGWAGQQHLRAYSELDGVRIVSLAGMEQELRDSLQAEYAIPNGFGRWEEMLDHGGLDTISVAVPTFLHAPIAIAALERGIHVLSEKPIARNAVEGQAMVDAARKAGRVLDVAFNHRRRGDIQALKEVIDAGGLGRPYYAKASWLRRSGIPTLGSWFTNPELAGGGPLADIGVHALDYALHLLVNRRWWPCPPPRIQSWARRAGAVETGILRRPPATPSRWRTSRQRSSGLKAVGRSSSRPAGPPTGKRTTCSTSPSTAATVAQN